MFSTPPVFDYQFQVLIAGVLTILFLIVLFLDNFSRRYQNISSVAGYPDDMILCLIYGMSRFI